MPTRKKRPRVTPRRNEPLNTIPATEKNETCSSSRPGAAQSETSAGPSGEATASSTGGLSASEFLEAQAEHLDAMGWSCALYGSLHRLFGTGIDKFAYKPFVDHFLGEMAPLGPLERMMAEQLLLSHHALGHLQVRGMNANHPDAAKVYLAAAARLMAEFRLTAVALRGLKSPPPLASPPSDGIKMPHVAPPLPPANEVPGDGATTAPDWISELRSKRSGKGARRAKHCTRS